MDRCSLMTLACCCVVEIADSLHLGKSRGIVLLHKQAASCHNVKSQKEYLFMFSRLSSVQVSALREPLNGRK